MINRIKCLVCLSIIVHLALSTVFAQQEKTFIYDHKGRRDPLLPLVNEKGQYLLDPQLPYSSSEIKISGILWDPQGRSSVIVNNQIVKVGESVSGFMIERIDKESVTISKDGKKYIMKLSVIEEE